MDKLILIYLRNTTESLQKITSTQKIVITFTRSAKNKLFQTIRFHKSSQMKLWPDFSKKTCKEVAFQESYITCEFSSKIPHKYLSWTLTRVFYTPLFQSVSFPQHFSVDVFISIYTVSITFTFLVYNCQLVFIN